MNPEQRFNFIKLCISFFIIPELNPAGCGKKMMSVWGFEVLHSSR
jgi:hypothetical protein